MQVVAGDYSRMTGNPGSWLSAGGWLNRRYRKRSWPDSRSLVIRRDDASYYWFWIGCPVSTICALRTWPLRSRMNM
jgi:hypothetical protein